MIRIVGPVVLLIVAAVVLVALYMVVRRFEQGMVVRRKRDELRLKTEEWQAVAALEDLAAMRRRIEGDLDDLHEEMDQMGEPVERNGRLEPPTR